MWLRKKLCKHTRIRCIHGEEIKETSRRTAFPFVALVRCLDCNTALYDAPTPEICYYTGSAHH